MRAFCFWRMRWLGEAYSEAEIVSALGTSPRTIERLRKRFVTEGLEAALDHRPQPPRPDKVKIKGNVEQTVARTGLQRSAARALPLDLTTAGRRTRRLGLDRYHQHGDRVAGTKKNDIKPWIVKTWCVPPKADAEFVWRMEDVLQTYLLPYDPSYPVVCFDEACKQLFGEVRPAQRTRRVGRPGSIMSMSGRVSATS